MAKKLTSALGVDIGSRSIKIAEVRAQGGGAVVTALGSIDTPEGAVDHTGIYNPEAVASALKQCITNAGASVPQCIVSIQGQASVLVRTLQVPRMAPGELKGHMEWEMSRSNPFAEANPIFDFAPLHDDKPQDPNIDVVMAIASPHAVETIRDSIKKAGKQAVVIDVEPLAVARVLQTTLGGDYAGQTVCVVNVGHKSTSINIYKDGNVLMPRVVPVGGENFTRAVADRLAVPMADAEQVKVAKADLTELNVGGGGGGAFSNPFAAPAPEQTQAFQPYNPFADDPMPAAPADMPAAADEPAPVASTAPATVDDETARVNDAMSIELDEFVAEIRRSIDYYRSRGGDVSRLLVTGGGAEMKGMAAFLGDALGLPCDSFDPLSRLNVSAKNADADFLAAHREEFAVAIGNGLHILF